MNQPVKVKFQECTKSEYETMSQHSNDIVYSCYDTGELFKGAIAFGGGDTPEPSNNDFVVTYTESGGTYTASDKDGNPVTFADIKTAIEAGKNVRAINGNCYLSLANADLSQTGTITFSVFYGASSVMFITHDYAEQIAVVSPH